MMISLKFAMIPGFGRHARSWKNIGLGLHLPEGRQVIHIATFVLARGDPKRDLAWLLLFLCFLLRFFYPSGDLT